MPYDNIYREFGDGEFGGHGDVPSILAVLADEKSQANGKAVRPLTRHEIKTRAWTDTRFHAFCAELNEMERRGWITQINGRFAITSAGEGVIR